MKPAHPEQADLLNPTLPATTPAANSNQTPNDDDDQHFWRDNRDSIVLHEQPETAVYRNPRGGIVIRQERHEFQDEDPFVFFSTAEAARKVVKAILRELGDAD